MVIMGCVTCMVTFQHERPIFSEILDTTAFVFRFMAANCFVSGFFQFIGRHGIGYPFDIQPPFPHKRASSPD